MCCKYNKCQHFALFNSGDQEESSQEVASDKSDDEDWKIVNLVSMLYAKDQMELVNDQN